MNVDVKINFTRLKYEQLLNDKYFIETCFSKKFESYSSKNRLIDLLFSIKDEEKCVSYIDEIECYEDIIFPTSTSTTTTLINTTSTTSTTTQELSTTTTTTSILERCLVVNSTFDTDLSGWTTYNDLGEIGNSWIWVDGRAAYNASDSGGCITQDILEIGKTYRISLDLEVIDGGCGSDQSRIQINAGDTSSSWYSDFGVNTVEVILQCTGNTRLCINGYDNCRYDNFNFIFIDNVCVTEI